MKTSVCIALILAVLAIISAIIGVITKQFDLFGCISLACSYTGMLAGLVAWGFFIWEWEKQNKKWEKENNNS